MSAMNGSACLWSQEYYRLTASLGHKRKNLKDILEKKKKLWKENSWCHQVPCFSWWEVSLGFTHAEFPSCKFFLLLQQSWFCHLAMWFTGIWKWPVALGQCQFLPILSLTSSKSVFDYSQGGDSGIDAKIVPPPHLPWETGKWVYRLYMGC